MRRVFLASLLLTCALAAQKQPPQPAPPKQEEPEPPEEDESFKTKEYAFNPIEATRNITAGNFYFKKGNFRAAAKRYEEATRWDPTSAEGFLKLAEADERLKDRDGARKAYVKYLELAPDAKNAAEIKKKLDKLPESPAKK